MEQSSAIKTAILEKAGEGQIEYAEYSNLILDELVVPDGHLNEADKAFLELFTECKCLSLNSCGLTLAINMPQIAALTRLELSDNKIDLKSSESNPKITWPENLTCLKLAGNQLSDLETLIETIKPLQKLTSIDIADNPCSFVEKSSNAEMKPAVEEKEAEKEAEGLPKDMTPAPTNEPIGEHALKLRAEMPNLKAVDGKDMEGNDFESESEEDFSQEDEDDDSDDEEDDIDEEGIESDENDDMEEGEEELNEKKSAEAKSVEKSAAVAMNEDTTDKEGQQTDDTKTGKGENEVDETANETKKQSQAEQVGTEKEADATTA